MSFEQLISYNLTLNKVNCLSPVCSAQDLRTGGRWFDPRLSKYSFRGLMIGITSGFIPLSLLSVVWTMVKLESSQWLGKNFSAEYWSKELQNSMDRCTGRRDRTEILSKTALNTMQSTK